MLRYIGCSNALSSSSALPRETARPLWSPVAVFSDSPALLALVSEGLRRMDCREVRTAPVADAALRPGETGFLIHEAGEEATVFTAERTLLPEEKTMLLLSLFSREQKVLFDLPGVPRAAEQMSPFQAADESEACFRQRMLLEDGIAAVFFLCGQMKQGPIETLMENVPETHILTRDVECGVRDKGRILRAVLNGTALPRTLGEGVRIRHEKGYATIVPDAHRSIVRVTGESQDSEFARELCDFYLDQIRKIANSGENRA